MENEKTTIESILDTLNMLANLITHECDRLTLLQNRVLELEIQVRCTHLFKNEESYNKCVNCGQERSA